MNDKSKALFLMVVLCIGIVLGLGSITRGRETVKFTGKVGGKLLGGGHQVRVIKVYYGNIQAGENLQVKYVDRHGDFSRMLRE